MELPLALAITEPIEVHVHGLGAFLFDRVIDYPTGSVVVHLQRCGQLRVTKFIQSGADWAEGLGIEEQAPNLASAALETTWHMIWQRT